MSLQVLVRYRELFPDEKMNVLRSFAIRDNDIAAFCKRFRPFIGSLILDSGTWTLNQASSSIPISVEKFIAYLRIAAKYFDFYFNFDSNFESDGFDENYANQLKIEESGFNPVPVVHDVEGDEIQIYIDKGYRRVALG